MNLYPSGDEVEYWAVPAREKAIIPLKHAWQPTCCNCSARVSCLAGGMSGSLGVEEEGGLDTAGLLSAEDSPSLCRML